MRTLIILLFISFMAPLYAAEPVVNIPPLPPEDKLEIYEDSEELFMSKVMEYYNYSLMLNTQLRMMGVLPYQELFPPSFDELLDLDIETILKYYEIAKKVEALVLLQPDIMPYTLINEMKQDMRDTIIFYENMRNDLQNELHTKAVQVIRQRDSVCNESLQQLEDAFFNDCRDVTPLLALSFFGSQFLFESPVKSKISPGIRLSLNGSSVLGFGKRLNIFYEYIKPVIRTDLTDNFNITNEYKWDAQFQSVGGNFEIGPLAGGENYVDGLKLGLGYFWSAGSIYNTPTGDYNWEGAKMDLEYFGGIPNCRYPFEVFFRLSILHSFSDDLVFNIYNPVQETYDMNDTRFAFSFGLRYNFWKR